MSPDFGTTVPVGGEPRTDDVRAVLVHHGRSDPVLLREWLEKASGGLLPYRGAWRTRDEIDRIHRESGVRSLLVTVEVVGLLGIVIAADLLLWVVLRALFY